jgi:hypothetical protein
VIPGKTKHRRIAGIPNALPPGHASGIVVIIQNVGSQRPVDRTTELIHRTPPWSRLEGRFSCDQRNRYPGGSVGETSLVDLALRHSQPAWVRGAGEPKGQGAELVSAIRERLGPEPIEVFAPYAGEAAELVLEAIAAAGDDRAAVTGAILSAQRQNGIFGSYRITDNGNPTVGPVSIFVASDSFEPVREITPSSRLVAAARGR